MTEAERLTDDVLDQLERMAEMAGIGRRQARGPAEVTMRLNLALQVPKLIAEVRRLRGYAQHAMSCESRGILTPTGEINLSRPCTCGLDG